VAVAVVLGRDPRSAIRDPRSAIRDPRSAIRDPRVAGRFVGGCSRSRRLSAPCRCVFGVPAVDLARADPRRAAAEAKNAADCGILGRAGSSLRRNAVYCSSKRAGAAAPRARLADAGRLSFSPSRRSEAMRRRLVHRRRGACHADADGGQVVFDAWVHLQSSSGSRRSCVELVLQFAMRARLPPGRPSAGGTPQNRDGGSFEAWRISRSENYGSDLRENGSTSTHAGATVRGAFARRRTSKGAVDTRTARPTHASNTTCPPSASAWHAPRRRWTSLRRITSDRLYDEDVDLSA